MNEDSIFTKERKVVDKGSKVMECERFLAQVIDNLLTNASKFPQPNTAIFVTLETQNQTVRISVRDEEPGIPQEDLGKLFGTFQRLTAQPTGGEKSTGLGLSIVKKIVDAHQGKIKVDSEVAKGTTFTVFILYRQTLRNAGYLLIGLLFVMLSLLRLPASNRIRSLRNQATIECL